jgi:hypothetical protein
MRYKVVVLIAALALASAACTKQDETVEPQSTQAALGAGEFQVTGELIDAKADVGPEGGIPGDDAKPMDPDEDSGGIAVRPNAMSDAQGVDGCTTQKDAYVIYYTADSEFDPSDLADADDFPVNLKSRTVTVRGAKRDPVASASPASSPAPGCVLVAEDVQVQAEADSGTGNTGTGDTGGGTGAPTSPGASGDSTASPGPTGSTTFPDNADDANTIFEGTPSPDPCEGQKACEQHRETGQEPQP